MPRAAVNSVCPGWTRTDMGGSMATRSVEEGADCIVWLASEAEHSLSGRFLRDRHLISWEPFGRAREIFREPPHSPGMRATHLIPLLSGGTLAVDEDGDPHGTPVFFFHGWPASRLQGAGLGPAARRLGVRLLSPDRPGIGLSTHQPGRRLLDWPAQVREAAVWLGMERFRVICVSGGAPYALAAGHALPDLIEAVAVISGAPPLAQGVDPKALLAAYRWLLAVYRVQPGAIRGLFRLARPVAITRPPRWMWPLILRFVPEADRAALADGEVFEGSFGCYQEAWRGGSQGVVADAEIYAQDWGFEPEDVRVPVRLWHGLNDESFSWRLAEALANRLPDCTARFMENEVHYSLPIRHGEMILEDLLRSPVCP
jgi:pimeloyl-ACP methyl ester carboxylesterase